MLSNPRMSSLLRLLPGLLCLAAALPSQGEGEEDVKTTEEMRRAKAAAREARGARGEKGEKGEPDFENLTPEERLARHVTSGASAYCRFLATVKPEKLMPGQSGTMMILATLQGDAVMPSPPPVLEVVNSAQQGHVTLGALAPRPATAGRHARGYLGRPVYDNYALLEVPVTMAPNAPLGSKHDVSVELKFDLYDGNSAQPIGRFLDRVTTTVEVGAVLDPAVQGRRATGAGDVVPAAATPEPEPSPDEPRTADAPEPPTGLEANAVVPPASAQPPSPAPSAADEPGPALGADDGGMPVPLLIGGGALVLAVVVLLARRR